MKLLTLSAFLLGLFMVFGLFGSGPDYSAPEEEGATLRIIATEEVPYTSEWERSFLDPAETTQGHIPKGDGYVDYPVPDEAFEDVQIREINVQAGDSGTVSWDRRAGLGALLYVDGEIVSCSHAASREHLLVDGYMGIASVRVDWDGHYKAGLYERNVCKSYRFFR